MLKNKIVFFDGLCNLCNSFVDFCIRHDKKNDLSFSSLQSDFAQRFFASKKVDLQKISTIYFYDDGRLYNRSTAALKIAQYFGYGYRLVSKFLLLFNSTFRDFVYDIVAKNRYRIWGKRNTCRLATEEEKSRFLEL